MSQERNVGKVDSPESYSKRIAEIDRISWSLFDRFNSDSNENLAFKKLLVAREFADLRQDFSSKSKEGQSLIIRSISLYTESKVALDTVNGLKKLAQHNIRTRLGLDELEIEADPIWETVSSVFIDNDSPRLRSAVVAGRRNGYQTVLNCLGGHTFSFDGPNLTSRMGLEPIEVHDQFERYVVPTMVEGIEVNAVFGDGRDRPAFSITVTPV